MAILTQLTPEAQALLETIAGPESAGNYDIIYGGQRFNDYSDHPRVDVPIQSGPNKGRTSSAAGKLQFIKGTWDDIAERYDLPDFTPQNQDRAGWILAQEEYKRDTGRSLQQDLASGDVSRVPGSLRNQWTSMPGGIEQGIGTSAFNKKYWENMGLNLNSTPDLAALDMASSGMGVLRPGNNARSINMATNRPAAEFSPVGERLPPVVPPGVRADPVGTMPTWRGMADLQGRPSVKGGGLFDDILGGIQDFKMPEIDVPGALTSAGEGLKKMVTSDPRLMIGAARDFIGGKIDQGLKSTFANDRVYKGLTLGFNPVAGAARVNVHGGQGGLGWITNPGANARSDAKMHPGQNMDIYRANVLAKQSGAPMVSAAPRQSGEAPMGMTLSGNGQYQDSYGGTYYERNL